MNKSKYLLVLPMALTVLTACGGSNFKTTTYEEASKIAENYVESIKASKAATIEVSGRINKLAITGDFTWWSASYEKTKGLEFPMSILGMIPNFSFENSEMVVAPQNIAKFSIAGSLMNVAESMFGIKKGSSDQISLLLLDNLPKFPMNTRMLELLYGVELSEPNAGSGGGIPWEYLKAKAWDSATTEFYSDNGRLKVTLATDDITTFSHEIKSRMSGEDPEPVPPEHPKYPASVTLTTNNIGYIDSVSIKTNLENVEKETPISDEMLFYYHLKGNIDIDVTLNFKQSIASPVTLKYLLREYNVVKGSESIDATYDGMNLHCKEVHPITSDLDSLKDYVTFDWFTNYNRTTSEMVENFDDPIFNMNYWHAADCAKNTAFTAENYDVMVFPTYTKDATKPGATPKYQILGAIRNYDSEMKENIIPSLISTSANGRIISSDQGLPDNTLTKALEPAADIMYKQVILEKDEQEIPTVTLDANELYINSNMLKADGTEYVISIAVLDLQGE